MRLSKKQSQKSKRFGIWLGLIPWKSRYARKKTHQVVGRKVIYAEEQHTCDWRKAEKFRENLDKI